MSSYVCRLITDEGTFYVTTNDTMDQIISPVFRSLDNYVRFMHNNPQIGIRTNPNEFREYAKVSKTAFVITKDTIFEVTRILAKLKCGKSLTKNEAITLYDFKEFLKFTIADHQRNYSEISQTVVEGWIDELDIRKHFPTGWDYQDILDHSNSKAYYEQYFAYKYPASDLTSPEKAPIEQCCKLSGRYISQLMTIADFAETNPKSPIKVINKFRATSDTSSIPKLNLKLKRIKSYERRNALLGVYKQLTKSLKGRQTQGDYSYLFSKDINEGLDFVMHMIELLSQYGLNNHARRLQKQYF